MAKYVIEIPDDRIGDFVGNTHLLMPYTMAGHKGHHDTGLEMTPYTEPDEQSVKNNNIHLCWSCQNSSECHVKVKDVLFGDDVGNDNICCCNAYRPTESNASDEDEIRQKAREEVWDFVRGLIHYNNGFGMDEDELRSCFGYELYSRVFKNLTYSEAKAKYETWKKQKAEIRVGDEVTICGQKRVVTSIDDEDTMAIDSDGNTYGFRSIGFYDEATKTGRHFPEVSELLKKMKENENEIHS